MTYVTSVKKVTCEIKIKIMKKMAAKFKKRSSKIENKLFKLDKLELKDVFCSICQSILFEPVTLPCFHDFCHRCFSGSIENNSLCCPLCRLRIGSWLRTATKQKSLINVELWNFIQSKFSREVDIKLNGEDVNIPEETPIPRLSEPGEIRSEYEAELKRLRAEQLQLELKHRQETEFLIKKIQLEEEEAQKRYTEALMQDELLAQKIQHEHLNIVSTSNVPRKQSLRSSTNQPRLKATKIDSYLSKANAPTVKDSPLITDDNTSSDASTPKPSTTKTLNGMSPEIVPSYGKLFKHIIDKKNKVGTGIWNKENGENVKEMKEDPKISSNNVVKEDNCKAKSKPASLLVSLPLPITGILQHKKNVAENRNKETGSADSMRQELCYFKPIEGTTPTSFNTNRSLPLRVPVVRLEQLSTSPGHEPAPSRAQYLEGLCNLRNISLEKNLPSAFVISLTMLRTQNENTVKYDTNLRPRVKKTSSTSPYYVPSQPIKKNATRNKQTVQIEGITKLNIETNLRRTRSMGSISKAENETTPKKAKVKQRKVSSERKPYLRSDSKKTNTKKELESPPLIPELLNNNKVNLAVKRLSSPLETCDVKKILQEQLRIEKLIEQEMNDLELARKMDAEWNGRRQPRRAAIKRQVTLNYALRPGKKLKV